MSGTDVERPEAAPAPAGGDDRPDGVPRAARVLVGVLLVLLLVPGVVGFDAWPLTGWRLFSLSRDDDQTRWVLQATTAGGEQRIVSLEELPLGYRHAEWPMADLPGDPPARRDAVCQALADAVVEADPATVELAIARDHARLVEEADGWTTLHDVQPFHTCTPTGAGEAP